MLSFADFLDFFQVNLGGHHRTHLLQFFQLFCVGLDWERVYPGERVFVLLVIVLMNVVVVSVVLVVVRV